MTDHDEVIAELRSPGGTAGARDALELLIRQGRAYGSRKNIRRLYPKLPVAGKKPLAQRLLDEERADR